MEKRNIICIGCPIGCSLEVVLEGKEVQSVSGNQCARGDSYAREECVHPTRVLTSTVRVRKGLKQLVSVKSRDPIPKELLLEAMKEISACEASAPVVIGQVLLPDLCGTGIPLIATGETATA